MRRFLHCSALLAVLLSGCSDKEEEEKKKKMSQKTGSTGKPEKNHIAKHSYGEADVNKKSNEERVGVQKIGHEKIETTRPITEIQDTLPPQDEWGINHVVNAAWIWGGEQPIAGPNAVLCDAIDMHSGLASSFVTENGILVVKITCKTMNFNTYAELLKPNCLGQGSVEEVAVKRVIDSFCAQAAQGGSRQTSEEIIRGAGNISNPEEPDGEVNIVQAAVFNLVSRDTDMMRAKLGDVLCGDIETDFGKSWSFERRMNNALTLVVKFHCFHDESGRWFALIPNRRCFLRYSVEATAVKEKIDSFCHRPETGNTSLEAASDPNTSIPSPVWTREEVQLPSITADPAAASAQAEEIAISQSVQTHDSGTEDAQVTPSQADHVGTVTNDPEVTPSQADHVGTETNDTQVTPSQAEHVGTETNDNQVTPSQAENVEAVTDIDHHGESPSFAAAKIEAPAQDPQGGAPSPAPQIEENVGSQPVEHSSNLVESNGGIALPENQALLEGASSSVQPVHDTQAEINNAVPVVSNLDVFENIDFKPLSFKQKLPEAKGGDVKCRMIQANNGFARNWVDRKKGGLILVISCENGSTKPIIGELKGVKKCLSIGSTEEEAVKRKIDTLCRK